MSLITITDVSTYCPFFGDGEEKTQKINIGITKAEDKLLGLLCEDTFDLFTRDFYREWGAIENPRNYRDYRDMGY